METTILNYKVKTAVFEGPIEVLLRLVEERKLAINEVSLAAVTDDFVAYVESLGERMPYDALTHFISTASTLLLIKAKSLLPMLVLTKEEEGSIRDLERRLRAYKKIQELSVGIQKIFGKTPMYTRQFSRMEDTVFAPDARFTLGSLLGHVNDILASFPPKTFLPQTTVKSVVRIEEIITSLKDRIEKSLTTSFFEFTGKGKNRVATKEEKVFVIVSFLALLELVRKGLAAVTQHEAYGDISIGGSSDVSIDEMDNVEP